MKKYLLLLILVATSACSSDDVIEVVTFPRYGNYCGYDRPALNETPIPIDATDAACKNHDACYVQRGNFNVTCDTILIAELKNISPKTEPERIARKSIITYFRNSPQKELMELNLDKFEF